jgi:perosamine synthetase
MGQINMSEIRLSETEIAAAVKVLRSGQLRQGKQCEAFEQEFAEKVGAKYAITCASGSAALHLAYMAFLKPGDEVLVPSFTFIATASMVAMTGATPVFCDIDPITFLIDLADAEQRVTSKTKAIAPVHLFGNVCDVHQIQTFARKHNLTVVWDAAQAHGATFKGNDVGSFGDFACYSFYPSKNMFVGEGGIVCTPDRKYAELLRYMRTHGQTGKYYHTMLGLNYRMTDVEAAIGLHQLMRLDEMLAVRRRNASVLNFAISAIPGIRPQQASPDTEHAWHQYCVVIDPAHFGWDRNEVAEWLKARGIMTGVHYPRGSHRQPVFEQLYGTTDLPHTDMLASNILALPVHHGLTEDQVVAIVEALEDCCSQAGNRRAAGRYNRALAASPHNFGSAERERGVR